MQPRLPHLAAEAAGRVGLSDLARWCVVCYVNLGRRPRLLRHHLGQVARELARRGLLDPQSRRFDVARLLAAAGLSWTPRGGVA